MMGILSLFFPSYPAALIYMLQNVEYEVGPYLSWYWRTKDFSKVMYRRKLDHTRAARVLLMAVRLGIIIQIAAGLLAIAQQQLIVGMMLIITYPIVWAHLITIPLVLGRIFLVKPKQHKLVNKSDKIFADHKGTVIAVAGSYGKTTVKELLLTILSEGKNVAATPANKNVAVSHAYFANKLKGDEDVLVIEYGEGQPGDIAKFAKNTRPDIGIITGLAPAHLNKYKTLSAAAEDLMSLSSFVSDENLFMNANSEPLLTYIKPSYKTYSYEGAEGWDVSEVQISVEGMTFVMKQGNRKLKLSSKLVGKHLIGPLALGVALAAKLGMSDKQIVDGVAKTKPYEHRMQPRLLAGGWVIDDTYNGNLEGVRAGLQLLSDLEANRKIYVTPGLVDQGKESDRVHLQVGELIAKANPTKVVLMINSATDAIKKGMKSAGYSGEVVLEDDPLNFYSNLDQIIAVGDIVLMQNDWTDNYN